MENKQLQINIDSTINDCPALIHDESSLEKAGSFIKTINKLIREVKETFDPIVKKAKETHTEALDQKKKHLSPLEDKKADINKMIISYNEMVAAKHLEDKEEKIEEAKENQDFFGEIEAETPADVSTPKGMSFRESWSAEVVDINKVPREYLVADIVKLNGIARALRDTAKIEGIKFNCKKTPVVR